MAPKWGLRACRLINHGSVMDIQYTHGQVSGDKVLSRVPTEATNGIGYFP